MQRKTIYRPTQTPTTALPFGTRSVGHYNVHAGYTEKVVIKQFVQLFWGIEGKGEFEIDGELYFLNPGEVCFYLPGDTHNINGHSEEWNYRWLTIDGDLNTRTFAGFNFAKPPSKAGPCPEELFLKLEREILDHTPRGQCLASATAYSILAIACGGSRKEDTEPSLAEQCIIIIKENFSDPLFDVNQLAEMMGINRSRLSRLFREEMHTTLKDYIIACRVQKGMSIIKETNIPIGTIAEKCGYSSADYFAKAIRKGTGFSPREFRHQ
jgi:AraC-like DNA-binding protein